MSQRGPRVSARVGPSVLALLRMRRRAQRWTSPALLMLVLGLVAVLLSAQTLSGGGWGGSIYHFIFSWYETVPFTAAGLVITGAALMRARSTGRAGLLTGLAGVFWSTQPLILAESAAGVIIGSAGRGLTFAALLLAAFSLPGSWPWTRAERWWGWAGATALAPGPLVLALLHAPRRRWWFQPGAWWPTLTTNEVLFTTVQACFTATGLVVAVASAVLAQRRWRRMIALQRRQVVPLSASLVAVVLASALFSAGVLIAGGAVPAFVLIQPDVWLLSVPVAAALTWRRRRATEEELATFFPSLGPEASAGKVEQHLRSYLQDPSLTLLFPLTADGCLTDTSGQSHGRDVLADRFAVPVLSSYGERLAVIATHPHLAAQSDLVRAAATTAGVVLENARMHSRAAARLSELERAQDAHARTQREERKRIGAALEQDLALRAAFIAQHGHDLAASVTDPASRASLRKANEVAAEAADQLLRISRGLRIQVLRDHGLAAALESRARAMPFTVRVDVPAQVDALLSQPDASDPPSGSAPDGQPSPASSTGLAVTADDAGRARLDPRASEALFDALYWCLSEAMHNARKHAHASTLTIAVTATEAAVLARVVDDGVGGVPAGGQALFAMRQRAQQAGGHVSVHSPAGEGTAVVITLPLGPDSAPPAPSTHPRSGHMIGMAMPSRPEGRRDDYERLQPRDGSPTSPDGRPGTRGARGLGLATDALPRLRAAAARLWERFGWSAIALPAGLLLLWVSFDYSRVWRLWNMGFDWGDSRDLATISLLLSVSLVVMGALLTRTLRASAAGVWLVITGVLWPLSTKGITGYVWDSAVVTWVVSGVVWLPILMALSTFPRGVPWRREHRLFIAVATFHLLIVGVGQAVIMEPEWVGFHSLIWWPTVAPMRGLWDVVNVYTGVGYVLLALWCVRILAARTRDLTPLDRALLVPGAWATAFAAVVAGGASFYQSSVLTLEAWATSLFIQGLGVALLPLSIAVAWLLTVNHRAEVTRVIGDLSRAPNHDQVCRVLREWLHDDSIDVLYWAPQLSGYVTADGTSTQPPSERDRLIVAVTSTRTEEPLALVSADARLRFLRLTLKAALADGYALENLRLHALTLARTREIERTRSAAVDAARVERQRAAGDLHEGPANTLGSCANLLDEVRRRHSGASATAAGQGGSSASEARALSASAGTASAREEADAARGADAASAEQVAATSAALSAAADQAAAQARALAHRLSSRVLHTADLGLAIDTVADDLPVPVDVQVDPRADEALDDERLRDLAYMLTCDALADVVEVASATKVAVDVTMQDADLVITVLDDGATPLTRRGSTIAWLRDRAATLDGQVEAFEASESSAPTTPPSLEWASSRFVMVQAHIPYQALAAEVDQPTPTWPALPQQEGRVIALPETNPA